MEFTGDMWVFSLPYISSMARHPQLQDLLGRCLQLKPSDRITSEQMAVHPWVLSTTSTRPPVSTRAYITRVAGIVDKRSVICEVAEHSVRATAVEVRGMKSAVVSHRYGILSRLAVDMWMALCRHTGEVSPDIAVGAMVASAAVHHEHSISITCYHPGRSTLKTGMSVLQSIGWDAHSVSALLPDRVSLILNPHTTVYPVDVWNV